MSQRLYHSVLQGVSVLILINEDMTECAHNSSVSDGFSCVVDHVREGEQAAFSLHVIPQSPSQRTEFQEYFAHSEFIFCDWNVEVLGYVKDFVL